MRNIQLILAGKQIADNSKTQRNAAGRVLQHLGYGNPHTGGIKLSYWAMNLELKLKLHIFSFAPELKLHLASIEKSLVGQLDPMIGDHS